MDLKTLDYLAARVDKARMLVALLDTVESQLKQLRADTAVSLRVCVNTRANSSTAWADSYATTEEIREFAIQAAGREITKLREQLEQL